MRVCATTDFLGWINQSEVDVLCVLDTLFFYCTGVNLGVVVIVLGLGIWLGFRI